MVSPDYQVGTTIYNTESYKSSQYISEGIFFLFQKQIYTMKNNGIRIKNLKSSKLTLQIPVRQEQRMSATHIYRKSITKSFISPWLVHIWELIMKSSQILHILPSLTVHILSYNTAVYKISYIWYHLFVVFKIIDTTMIQYSFILINTWYL